MTIRTLTCRCDRCGSVLLQAGTRLYVSDEEFSQMSMVAREAIAQHLAAKHGGWNAEDEAAFTEWVEGRE